MLVLRREQGVCASCLWSGLYGYHGDDRGVRGGCRVSYVVRRCEEELEGDGKAMGEYRRGALRDLKFDMFKQFSRDSSNIEIQEVSTLTCKGRGMHEPLFGMVRD